MKTVFAVAILILMAGSNCALATNYSMGCVEKYSGATGFTTADDVSLTCDATDGFSFWFNLFGGHRLRFYWHDTLVWPSDYTEDSFGGNDVNEIDWSSADLNVFSGHGSCQNPPTASSPDFIVTAKNGIGRGPNFVNINASLRLGGLRFQRQPQHLDDQRKLPDGSRLADDAMVARISGAAPGHGPFGRR
jgi:hypothetical protein